MTYTFRIIGTKDIISGETHADVVRALMATSWMTTSKRSYMDSAAERVFELYGTAPRTLTAGTFIEDLETLGLLVKLETSHQEKK